MSKLVIRYEPDSEDDVGKLWFSLTTDQFAGVGYFWSYRDGVGELAEKLSRYPLSGPASAAWGYDDLEGTNVILGVRITQVNGKGDLIAEVEIADLDDSRQRVTASFATKYSEVTTFGLQLKELAKGTVNEAVLVSA